MSEESENRTGAELDDAGAGTGASTRDMGEEGTMPGIESDRAVARTTDQGDEWRAVAGGTMTEEGAASRALRDEGLPAQDDDDERS